jgi:hypothetical protein
MAKLKMKMHDIDATYDPQIEARFGREKAIQECSKELIKMNAPVDIGLIREWISSKDWINA